MSESPTQTRERHLVFAEGLSKPERVLLVVRDALYAGSWEELVSDLEARRDREPFVYKLNTRIEDDLSRIAKLRSYEAAHGVDLGAIVADAGGAEEGMTP